MLYVYCFLAVLCLVSVGVFLMLRTQKANENSLIAKTFASLVFVTLGVISLIKAGNVEVKAMFVLGLVCGLIGDIILDLKIMYPEKKKTYFNFGTLMFGMGHILYFLGVVIFIADKAVTGFWWLALAALALSVVLSLLIVKMSPKLKLDMTGYKWQCGLYSVALNFMMLISVCLAICWNPICWILAVGFTLFLASDLVLSMQYFGGKEQSTPLIVVNHVLYYVAQILLATFIFFI